MTRFSDRPWPEILARVSQAGADEERRELKERLSSDSRFREEFCEWIKTLRNPPKLGAHDENL